MELQDIAANFREQNAHLVPIMLKRLWEIQKKSSEEKKKEGPLRRFPKSSNDDEMNVEDSTSKNENLVQDELMPGPAAAADEKITDGDRVSKVNRKKCTGKNKASSAKVRNQPNSSFNSSLNASLLNDSSNSSWAEMELYVIGIYENNYIIWLSLFQICWFSKSRYGSFYKIFLWILMLWIDNLNLINSCYIFIFWRSMTFLKIWWNLMIILLLSL